MTSPAEPVSGTAVRVNVPASSANLGPGFDAVGLALGVWDSYDVVVEGDGLVVDVTGEGADEVPRDERHLVVRCLLDGLHQLGVAAPRGLRLVARNGVPHARGMGSSATAAVAGYALASVLADVAHGGAGRVDLDAVNRMAAAREGHPDNSSASVYGGMTLSWTPEGAERASVGGAQVRTVRLEVHPDVVPVVLVPPTCLSTAAARAALPAQVPLGEAAAGAGRAALLVEAMGRRPELLLPATRDWLHQERRRPVYPASMELVDGLRAQGHAAVISGAGPTVLVLATTSTVAQVRAQELPAGWLALAPGVPVAGLSAVRLDA